MAVERVLINMMNLMAFWNWPMNSLINHTMQQDRIPDAVLRLSPWVAKVVFVLQAKWDIADENARLIDPEATRINLLTRNNQAPALNRLVER